ncbi:CP2 transcription factor [Penicillium angulare]|uniref:CP2 transcription factor n=1 Tax=Penicillium angulare TaxID=116970 RepID=UPI0025418EED|nr:CP2 transcription factor [Penicillium angulare]KAJ5288251.1 CP2 transcription factor [Penicillium angulare]
MTEPKKLDYGYIGLRFRDVSVLALRSDKEDNPDQYPVDLLKLTACFFIRPSNEANNVFCAIYLSERTAEDMKREICEKYHIEPSKIVRLLRIINDDLKVIIDEDIVRELPEGQTMIVDICETTSVVDGDSCLKEIRLKY